MLIPLQITFHKVQRSDALESSIRRHVDRLEQYCESIIGCRVTVAAPHHHHRAGNHFLVRIELTVPDEKLVIDREPDLHQAYTDVYVAVRDSFDAMRRRLEDYVRRRRGQVKTHVAPLHGRVAELTPEQDFGRIETPDGRLIYFHRDSVIGAEFDALRIGAEVRFDEEKGERGPQASTVRIIGKHHIPG